MSSSTGRYVPPHKRGNPTDAPPSNPSPRPYYGRRDPPTSYGKPNNLNFPSNFGNSRWSSEPPTPSPTGGTPRSTGSAGYSSYRSFHARPNSLGYHGNFNPPLVMERQLFESGDVVTQGINFDRFDEIPVDLSGNSPPDPILEFLPETIPPALMDNVTRSHFTRPTPVQKFSIPIGLANRDLMACAQTGSGKTGGFLFPLIISMLKSGPRYRSPPDHRIYPTGLILAPTRELAEQIYKEAEKFCFKTGIYPVVVYGGVPFKDQLREVERGADILVGTPGRLVDFYQRGKVSFSGIKYLILDEADKMLNMGFEPQIRQIVDDSDMPKDRQTSMFSATFPKEIQELASDFLKDYLFLAIGRVGAAASDIVQSVLYVPENEKQAFLCHFIREHPEERILVFVDTKRQADILQNELNIQNIGCASIHGDRSQEDRDIALDGFRKGLIPILVATDVASRGLDIPDVQYVINYDLPSNIEDYVHRIGRTGRAGNEGHAISYYNDNNRNISNDLIDRLIENDQEIPDFLESVNGYGNNNNNGGYNNGGGRYNNRYNNNRGGSGGNNRFGGRDYRNNNNRRGGGGGGGSGSVNNNIRSYNAGNNSGSGSYRCNNNNYHNNHSNDSGGSGSSSSFRNNSRNNSTFNDAW